jgi:hypothetical protein
MIIRMVTALGLLNSRKYEVIFQWLAQRGFVGLKRAGQKFLFVLEEGLSPRDFLFASVKSFRG